MFSLKRISKFSLSVLCMLSCVFVFSFVFATKGDKSTIVDFETDTILCMGEDIGNGEWIMGKVKSGSNRVSARMRFICDESGRTHACEVGGAERHWILEKDGWSNDINLVEVKGFWKSRVAETFTGGVFDGHCIWLCLNRHLCMQGVSGEYNYITCDGTDKYIFCGLEQFPQFVQVLMACFLPEGPLGYVPESW